MFEGAMKELALLCLMFGGPALMAVLWERHRDRKAWKSLTNWEAFSTSIHEGINKGYADEVARQRQVRKDDHIFNTVEEYRNADD